MRRRSIVAVALALSALGVAASPALAAERVIAGPVPISYLTTSVTIDRGEGLSLLNLDLTAPHDVSSVARGADGSPLFKSEVIPGPMETPVVGAEALGGGSYPFFCSIHPSMRGTLNVVGGAGGGSDSTAPTLRLGILDDRIRVVLRRGKLLTQATVSEAAGLRLRATARAGGRTATVATGSARFDRAGRRRIALRLTRDGKRLLGRVDRIRMKLTVRAKDEAGNVRRGSVAKTLR